MKQTRENGQKTILTPILTPDDPISGRDNFFSKIGLRHFSPLISLQLCVQNQTNPMMGSIIIFVADRQTDGQTD